MKTAAYSELINLQDLASLTIRHPLLIAHRGGVIAPDAPENSLAAIQLAAVRGYDMVELDVAEAKDHEPVLFHDWTGSLLVNCGIDAFIHELTSVELTTLRYRASDQHIATLAEALALCQTLKLGVMLDIKTPSQRIPSPTFFQRLRALLDTHQLTGASMTFADHPLARTYLTGRAMFAISKEDLQQVSLGQSTSLQGQFWFGAPYGLSAQMIKALQENEALVIPAINTILYPAHAHYELARQDVEQLFALGVDGFQIDSVYEKLLASP
jgi:glycerophosphoryl diester phosphodiesterase